MRHLCVLLPFLLSACAELPAGPAPDPAAGKSADLFGEEEAARSGSAEAVQELVLSSRASRTDGDYSHALSDIERAIRIDPRNPYLWLELGETHLARGDTNQAVATARRAMSFAGPDRVARAAAEALLDRASRR